MIDTMIVREHLDLPFGKYVGLQLDYKGFQNALAQ